MTDRSFYPKSGRQQRIAGYIDFDVSKGQISNGVATKAFWIPSGAFDITGSVTPLVAFNSATSDVVDVGNVTTGNAYKDDANIHALTLTPIALASFPVQSPQGFWVYVTWTGVGAAPTAGKFRLKLEYLMENRDQFDHGEDR